MSECVVRMEMPSNCERCPMCGTEGCGNGMYKLWCMCGDIPASSQRRPDDCPIICQLPEGHGRLGDLDRLEKMVNAARIDAMQKGSDTNPYWLLGDIIAQAKTIVPADTAERSET